MFGWRLSTTGIVLILLLAGCAEPPTDATGPLMGGQGEARLTLKQTVDSNLPDVVDRAFVRIWKNETGFNKVRDVAIPDPSDTTNVSLSVPADSGYSVGVIAYVADTANVNQSNASIPANIALAGGRTDSVAVAADTTTNVDLNVVPWEFDVSTNKDTLTGGGTVEVSAEVSRGPSSTDEFLGDIYYFMDTSPWNRDAGGFGIGNVPSSQSFQSTTLDVPKASNPNRDTTAYLQFAVTINEVKWLDDEAGYAFGHRLAVFYPALVDEDSLLSFPLEREKGSINISFDKAE